MDLRSLINSHAGAMMCAEAHRLAAAADYDEDDFCDCGENAAAHEAHAKQTLAEILAEVSSRGSKARYRRAVVAALAKFDDVVDRMGPHTMPCIYYSLGALHTVPAPRVKHWYAKAAARARRILARLDGAG